MGTVARLRKIIKEESAKLGHDIGHFRKNHEEILCARCLNCGLWAAIHIDDNSANWVASEFLAEAKYTSGIKVKEVHPPKSKGTIGGQILSVECRLNKEITEVTPHIGPNTLSRMVNPKCPPP